MESMDNFRERFEALEQQTHTLARQARWWRGIACGVIVLALAGIPLQSGTAQYEAKDLAQRIADLEYKLEYVSGGPNEVVITGANLRIVNGLGSTETTNALGNLIVGYNESREGSQDCFTVSTTPCRDTRTGSHNIIVGKEHNFSSFGGLVAGRFNEMSGEFASVSGGSFNTASGLDSSVSGGRLNIASVEIATVSGGVRNTASGVGSSVSGGGDNIASAFVSSVIGGAFNTASGSTAAISGGQHNTASGIGSSVSGGGENNTASNDLSSVSGGQNNTASGRYSSVSGGERNTASGRFSSVSGGTNRTAPGEEDWAAGPLFATN